MNPIELSVGQALKVFWSFLWRGWVLAVPVAIVYGILQFLFSPAQNVPSGVVTLDPTKAYLTLVSMVGAFIAGIVVQALAMRWALKAKWSDFRITTVSTVAKQM